MSKDNRDDLVGDVAAALTLDQQVQWERCARLAAGAGREKIENLRVIERVLASRRQPQAGAAPHPPRRHRRRPWPPSPRRWPQFPGRRSQIFPFFSVGLSGSLLPYVIRHIEKLQEGFCPERHGVATRGGRT